MRPDLKGWVHCLEVKTMSDTWSGKYDNLSWYHNKTPITVLKEKQQQLLRRHELVYQMLKMRQAKIDLAVAAYPSSPRASHLVRTPWVAINASPDTYGWILSGSERSKRDAELLELLRRCHKDVERIAGIIKSREGTPAAAAASEEYQ